jgi:hypothetical protein
MLYLNEFSMTYRSVAQKTMANRDFFVFSGPTPFSATAPVVGTGLAMLLLTTAAGFGIPVACTCGCGGRGGGSVVCYGSISSCLLASRSLRLLATIPETSSTSSSSSSGQSAITHQRLLARSFASFRSIISFGFSLAEVPSEV